MLREKIKEETGFEFNSMLANLYRDNKDSVVSIMLVIHYGFYKLELAISFFYF